MTLPIVTGEFRAAADPELRFAPSGVAVGKVRAVASSRKKNENDEWVDDKTCWVNITGFKQVAENMAESISKGDLITVVGKVSTDDWEDSDGNKRTSINIIADSIGPSLAYATAKVTKTQRSGSGGGAQGDQSREGAAPQGQDPWATPQSDEPPF